MRDSSWEHVHAFLDTITPWANAYVHSGFSYLAVRTGSTWTLAHGRLYLRSEPLNVEERSVVIGDLAAGHIKQSSMTEGYRALVEALAETGSVDTQIGRMTLKLDEGQDISAFFEAFHSAGMANQNRLPILTLRGDSRASLIAQPASDWAVRSAVEPFESVAEFANEFLLGGYQGDSAAIEIVAQPVVVMDSQSTLSGEVAHLRLLLAADLDRSKARLGYRILSKGVVHARGSYSGDQLNWSGGETVWRAEATLPVPAAAVVHCFASYADVTQNFYWVGDPMNSQNARRKVTETCDPGLDVIADCLLGPGRPRKDSREFEAGVAALAWLLGFSPWHLGAGRRLTDAPDILLTASSGDLLVIECTTGLLRADNKMARLVERSMAIEQSLAASGNGHVRVLPAIVTALEKSAVDAELEAARSARVLVVTREDLQDLLQRTIMVSDSKAIFDEAWKSLEEAQKQGGLTWND